MPYRSVDLQVSIPRVPEHSASQQQQIHRNLAEQTRIEAAAIKQTEQMREQNMPVEQAYHAELHGNMPHDDSMYRAKRATKTLKKNVLSEEHHQVDESEIHPYKGKHIDISF